MNRNNLFDLSGKIAIVTGPTGYLGPSISSALGEAGAEVYVAGRSKDKCHILANELSKSNDAIFHGTELDMTSQSSIKNCFKSIIKKHDGIDILINNAFFSSQNNFEKISEKNWKEGIDGTLNGVFRTTTEILPIMMKNKNGSIINISSIYGMVSPDPSVYKGTGQKGNPPDYGAGKAAIIQLTRYIACHYAKYGIRANTISPGAFPNQNVQKNKKMISNLIQKIPMGRIGKPEELKGIVIFLGSSASSYVTGQNFIIDGGWTAW